MVISAPEEATRLAGKNCAVSPAGNPAMVSVTDALKVELGVVVSVRVLETPAPTLIEVADEVSVNDGAGAIVIESDNGCLVDPLLGCYRGGINSWLGAGGRRDFEKTVSRSRSRNRRWCERG